MAPTLRVLVLGAALLGGSLATGAWGALAFVAASCAVAALVDERWSALALIGGALAALAFVAVGAEHPALAGALWSVGVWGARAARGADARARGAVVSLALIGGLAGATAASTYGGDSSTVVRLAALVVAGLLGSVAALVAVDDPVATDLRWSMLARRERVDEALARALDLRRRAVHVDGTARVDAEVEARIARAWASLAGLARSLAGARSRGAAPAWMVARVESHVAALERVHRSLEAHLASSVRIADPQVADVELASESLDVEVRALDEVIRERGPSEGKPQEISVG